MSESIHKKLNRVRKPRVHITYEVETNGAQVVKDLPFVMGVVGDFAGNPTAPLKRLDERKFINIDRDNFNDVMKRLNVGLTYKVQNTMAGDGSEFQVNLKFQSMEDFEPGQVVEQVKPLKQLLETRNRLRDLLSNADRSQKLEASLEAILQNTEKMQQLKSELGSKPEDDK